MYLVSKLLGFTSVQSLTVQSPSSALQSEGPNRPRQAFGSSSLKFPGLISPPSTVKLIVSWLVLAAGSPYQMAPIQWQLLLPNPTLATFSVEIRILINLGSPPSGSPNCHSLSEVLLNFLANSNPSVTPPRCVLNSPTSSPADKYPTLDVQIRCSDSIFQLLHRVADISAK
jgi:hypothetical protein